MNEIQVKVVLTESILKINSYQLHALLPPYIQVHLCENSEQALIEAARGWPADLVIGDLTLRDGDIIHVSTLLQDTPTVVGCCLPSNSAVLTHFLHQMGFDIVCTYSNLIYTLKDVCKKIRDHGQLPKVRHPFSLKQLDLQIVRVLRRIGMPCDQKGYLYAREAIALWALAPNSTVMITKSIYPEIAKRHGTTAFCVERAIRGAVDKAWKSCSTYTRLRYFGSRLATRDKRPSNADFIGALANYILLQMEDENPYSCFGQ